MDGVSGIELELCSLLESCMRYIRFLDYILTRLSFKTLPPFFANVGAEVEKDAVAF